MIKPYLPYEPDQQLLLPAALQEWLPDDHLAYFISDVVDQLDMSKVTARYERERRGGPPYHPRMMVKVLLYGYCVGVASSRRIAQAADDEEDRRYGKDKRGDELPEELAFRERRLEKIREAMAALGLAGATGKISCRDPLSLTRKHR